MYEVTMRQVRAISRKDFRPSALDVGTIVPLTGHYLAGFADGEGSFNVSFRRRRDYRYPWKVSLCFNVSQRDPTVLRLLREQLRCGTMRQRDDGVWYYEANTLLEIRSNVIPFFKEFGFRSVKKQRDFDKFCEIADLMYRGAHLTSEGVRRIIELRRDMNDGGKRRYCEAEILQGLPSEESSETVRQTQSEPSALQR